MQPIVGYNFGGIYYSRLKETVMLGLKVATILSTFIFIVMLLFPKSLCLFFSSNRLLLKQV
ncbi:hypothetical protein KHA80_15070 [Anaerobacillus sp. HL2]|nr:hypothetical protein KHA80_15070 [Anaerobacillus sp. HL2]